MARRPPLILFPALVLVCGCASLDGPLGADWVPVYGPGGLFPSGPRPGAEAARPDVLRRPQAPGVQAPAGPAPFATPPGPREPHRPRLRPLEPPPGPGRPLPPAPQPPSPAPLQPHLEGLAPLLQRAVERYTRFDYPQTAAIAQRIARDPAAPADLRAAALLLEAAAHYLQEDPDRADRCFRDALRADPRVEPNPIAFPPALIARYRELKSRLEEDSHGSPPQPDAPRSVRPR